MGARDWQLVGTGIAIPMIGWALTEYFDGKLWVTVAAFFFAIALGCVCLIGLILAGMKERRLKRGLVTFLAEIEALQRKCANGDAPPPDTADLRERLGDFLRKELGNEAIIRLNSHTGLPAVTLALPVPKEHKDRWFWLEARAIRLHEFIREANGTRP